MVRVTSEITQFRFPVATKYWLSTMYTKASCIVFSSVYPAYYMDTDNVRTRIREVQLALVVECGLLHEDLRDVILDDV
jgi:hypothetical protein